METGQASTVELSSPRATEPTLRWEGHMCDEVGATYGHVPLAFLSATRDELWLCGNRGNYRFPRSSIRKLGRGSLYPWLFRAVGIHHTIAGYPSDLQFKPLEIAPKAILRQLEQLGYPVA